MKRKREETASASSSSAPRSAAAAWDAVVAAPWNGKFGIRTATVDGKDVIQDSCFLPHETALVAPTGALAKQAVAQFQAYLKDPKHVFTLPLAPRGTEFQRAVWRHMQSIPVGRVDSYGDVARAIESAPRAVGGACRANPFCVVVPCHRIVAANGVGGFSGNTHGSAEIKLWLLRHEGNRY